MPPSAAEIYLDRQRKRKEPMQSNQTNAPFAFPSSTSMKLYLPSRTQGPITITSLEAITVEDVMREIYEYYQQRLDIHTIPPRKRAEIKSAFQARCNTSLQVGGPELEYVVKERGFCQVDRLCGEVQFESLTLVSVAENAWELHLIRAQD